MNLPFRIAKRYLFAKKTTNAINVITMISVFGIAIQAAAFVLVISVFNGFEDLFLSLFSKFNPEIKITPAKGKTFAQDTLSLEELSAIDGVQSVSQTLEEIAFFVYRQNQAFGVVKGVDTAFVSVTNIDSVITDGVYVTKTGNLDFAILGERMRNKLKVDITDDFSNLSVFMPKEKFTAFEQQFRKQRLAPIGVFSFQQDFDNKYVLTNLAFVQRLLGKSNQISALELRLSEGANLKSVRKAIQTLIGEGFVIQDRYEQEEAFLKIMNLEKWVGFAILSLTLLLLSFNIIGALWMIVLEKKKDISILKSMGIQNTAIRNIFIYEGGLLCAIGLGIGFGIAILLYVAQKQFGLIQFPGGDLTSAYPISMRAEDLVLTTIVIFVVGLIASLPAAYRAQRISAMPKEE